MDNAQDPLEKPTQPQKCVSKKKKKTQMQTLIISIKTHAYVNLKDKIAHSFAMRVSIQTNNSSSLPKS